MNLLDVKTILGAESITGEDLLEKTEVISACGSDLLSDVLAFAKEKALLLTGLTNPQVIRTAEINDLVGILFVRGKRPPQETVNLAKIKELPLLTTIYPLFETCGILYGAGLKGCKFGLGGEYNDGTGPES